MPLFRNRQSCKLIIYSSGQSRIRLAIDEVFLMSRETQASATSQRLRSDQAFQDIRMQSGLLAGISHDNAEIRNAIQSTISLVQTGQSLQDASQTSTQSPYTNSVIGIKAYVPAYRRSVCIYGCKCACHSPH